MLSYCIVLVMLTVSKAGTIFTELARIISDKSLVATKESLRGAHVVRNNSTTVLLLGNRVESPDEEAVANALHKENSIVVEISNPRRIGLK